MFCRISHNSENTCESNALQYHMDSKNEERVFRKTMGSHDPTSNAHPQIMSPRQLMVYHFAAPSFQHIVTCCTYCANHTNNIFSKTRTNNTKGEAVGFYVAAAKTSAHHEQTVATSDDFRPKHDNHPGEALRISTVCTIFHTNPTFHDSFSPSPRIHFSDGSFICQGNVSDVMGTPCCP